jgi:hypothetical protein
MIKQYKLRYGELDITLAVDHEKVTEKLLHEINDFWGDSSWRLSQCKNDICLVVLRLIAAKCFYLAISKDYNPYGVMDCFNDGDETEGFPPINGSCGIYLVNMDSFEIADDEIELISTIELNEKPTLPKGNM